MMLRALEYLRYRNTHKLSCTERNGFIVGDMWAWPRSTLTHFVKYGTGKASVAKKYYKLSTVLFLLKYHNISIDAYKLYCMVYNEVPVHQQDRDALLAYMMGETNTCDSLDMQMPYDHATHVSKVPKDGKQQQLKRQRAMRNNKKHAEPQRKRSKASSKSVANKPSGSMGSGHDLLPDTVVNNTPTFMPWCESD